MVSPARAHYLRVTAAAASAAAAANAPIASSSAYELMLAKLAQDQRRLSDIQSVERKAEVKRDLLPEYADWVQGALAADKPAQDDVLMTVMVWRIDAGDLAGALPIARHAIKHGLRLPERYKRDVATLVAEECADAARRARDGGSDVDVGLLELADTITAEHDMPDEVRAKLAKEIGLALIDKQPVLALRALERAMALHSKAGVKKEIERLKREIKNLAGA